MGFFPFLLSFFMYGMQVWWLDHGTGPWRDLQHWSLRANLTHILPDFFVIVKEPEGLKSELNHCNWWSVEASWGHWYSVVFILLNPPGSGSWLFLSPDFIHVFSNSQSQPFPVAQSWLQQLSWHCWSKCGTCARWLNDWQSSGSAQTTEFIQTRTIWEILGKETMDPCHLSVGKVASALPLWAPSKDKQQIMPATLTSGRKSSSRPQPYAEVVTSCYTIFTQVEGVPLMTSVLFSSQ